MPNLPYEKQTGGMAVHVKDCYLWAEIQYLDSSTDYRESLSANRVPPFSDSELTLEDERTGWEWKHLCASTPIAFLVRMFLLLIVRS
jgi:hypothetical protein